MLDIMILSYSKLQLLQRYNKLYIYLKKE